MQEKIYLLVLVIIVKSILNLFLGNNVGFDFYFGIPLTPAGQSPRYEVLIGTSSNTAEYVVESSEGGEISSGTATSTSPGVISIDTAFQVTSSAFSERMKGIRVYAAGTNPIYVLVIIKYNFFGNFPQLIAYSSIPILPNEENNDTDTYAYYATSTDYNGDTDITNRRSNVLLIGNYDNTLVSITPTQDNISLPQDTQNDGTQIVAAAGTTHTVTLHSLQTLGFSSLLDLTGTKIVSNRPLTVITGHQCAQVPNDVGFCEPTYVHLPPTFNWGQEFLLAPFAGRTANQQYKLVTSNSTIVEYRCGTQARERLEVLEEGSGRLFVVPNNSYCYLAASHPIFVVQYAPGQRVDNAGDTAIAAVAPISGHVGDSYFVSIPSDFPDNFITVTVQAQHFNASQIQLDGSILNCTWEDIYNTINSEVVGQGCTSLLSDSVTHAISHLGENGTLSVVAYGWSIPLGYGYAYLTNYNLQPVNGKIL